MERHKNPLMEPYAELRGDGPDAVRGEERRSCFGLGKLCVLLLACVCIIGAAVVFPSLIESSADIFFAGPKEDGYQNSWFYCGLKCGFDDNFLAIVSNETVAANFRHITAKPHVAGTTGSLEVAKYVKSKFEEYGLKAHFSEYYPALSYPVSRKLLLVEPSHKTLPLLENKVEGDKFSEDPNIIPPYLAYVPSGNVTAEVVYANYGRTEDFKKLAELGVDVTGSIVIVRYRAIFRGDKVTNAAKAGAAAIIIYSDPEDEAASGREGVYPDTKWLPPSGVQRGSALPRLHGDPTTPGWPSVRGSEHLPAGHPDVALPVIPAIPISYAAAAPILANLKGPEAPKNWWGGLSLEQHRVGRGPAKVNLDLQMDLRLAPIRNIHAIIEGADEPDRYVILGNHHDAWTFGGVDPNSGTAALLEVARGFGELLDMGWRPRRTIVLCNWDAEEMGLVGSTEWVEDNEDLLTDRTVAYINVDSATNGPGYLHGGATPQLDFLLWEAATKVKDPDEPSLCLLETWLKKANTSASGFTLPLMHRLGGSGTDYAGFVSHLGIAGIDFIYAAVEGSYPMYHTASDNDHWFEQFADPGFHRIASVAQLFGVVGLWLADLEVLPFNYDVYADELQANAKELEKQVVSLSLTSLDASPGLVDPLFIALEDLKKAAAQVNSERQRIFFARSQTRHALSTSQALETSQKVRNLNDRLMLAERAFVAPDGLAGRPWFRHLVYAPVRDNGYGSQAFPGIADAIIDAVGGAGGWETVQHEIHRVARAVGKAAKVLKGRLT